MDSITINEQEISFTPAPEFTYVSSLSFNGKAELAIAKATGEENGE